jgi:hypothetical protein
LRLSQINWFDAAAPVTWLRGSFFSRLRPKNLEICISSRICLVNSQGSLSAPPESLQPFGECWIFYDYPKFVPGAGLGNAICHFE